MTPVKGLSPKGYDPQVVQVATKTRLGIRATWIFLELDSQPDLLRSLSWSDIQLTLELAAGSVLLKIYFFTFFSSYYFN